MIRERNLLIGKYKEEGQKRKPLLLNLFKYFPIIIGDIQISISTI
jgi:hypothetical protein